MKANDFVRERGWGYVIGVVTSWKNKNPHLVVCVDSNTVIHIEELKNLVDAWEIVKKAGGLKEAKQAVMGNLLNASYYMQGGSYFRYGSIGVKVVRDGEYKEYYGGLDSTKLVHLDYLPKAIGLVESCQ